MSWKASAHVLALANATTREDLSPTHLLVLMALAARHHQDYGCAFGQLERIVEDTHLSESTVVEAINYLEDHDYLRVYYGTLPLGRTPQDKRKGKGSLYCFVKLDADEGPDIDGIHPRRRVGGRPKSVSPAPTQSVSPVLTDPAGDELGLSGRSVRTDGPMSSDPGGRSVRTGGGDELGLSQAHIRMSRLSPSESEPVGEPVRAGGEPVARVRAGMDGAPPAGDESAETSTEPDAEAEALWSATLEQLQAQTSAAHYAVYLAPTVGLFLRGDMLLVAPGNAFHVEWLEHRFGPAIAETVARVAGRRLRIQWRTLATAPPGHQAHERPHAAPAEALVGAQR